MILSAGIVRAIAWFRYPIPSDYLSVAKLGSIFNTMKDYEGAIALTEAYRRTDSTNVEVNRQNALAYCLRKEYPTAIKRYQDLTARGDSTLLTCYYLGVSYYATKEYYKARDWLLKAKSCQSPGANLLYYLVPGLLGLPVAVCQA